MAGAALTAWRIITGEYPPMPGGVSDHTVLLERALREAGCEVEVWRRGSGGSRLPDIAGENVCSTRLLLQWVPHAFGYRSMNLPLCWQLARRPEPLDLLVHEPCYAFGEGGLVQNAVAVVHRAMLAILLRKASRVFLTIPAWEPYLRPLTRRGDLAFQTLPAFSNIPVTGKGPETHPIGYFGQYDSRTIERLVKVLDALPCPVVLLGRGAERVPSHPRAVVIGERPPAELSQAISSCRVMFHLYLDGVSGRRTTAMASLAHGRAVVTNEGHLTEALWRASNAVVLSSDPASAITRLLTDDAERHRLSRAGLALYEDRFSLRHAVAKLMSLP